jgi:type I restriction enzyme S subunit
MTVSSERGVIPRRSATVTMFKAESYVGYKLCWPGDLVINSLWAWAGGLGVTQHHGIISSAYGVYRLRRPYSNYSRYIHELVRSSPFHWELQVRSKGIWISRLQLTDEAFLDIPFPVPPEEEQTAIVRFLAYADRRFGRYIRAKQQLIELLEEARRVIIHRAVSRGIDSHTDLKWSGVDRLGEIPKSWTVWQIGHFSRVGNGSTPSRGEAAYWLNGDYPWLNSSHANRSSVNSSDQFVTQTALQECHLPRVPTGSVLVAITGQGKTRGKATVLEMEATINQHLAYITPRPSIALVDYLQRALTAAYLELRAISDDSGSTKGALTCEDLKHFRVALPPLEEQQAIVEAIDNQVRHIEMATARAIREIDLLREYRTRLIADTVTGKLDVREASANLPDESEEPEELEFGEDTEVPEDELVEEEVRA